MLTTPLGLTACGHELNGKNSYEDINDYAVINGEIILKTKEEIEELFERIKTDFYTEEKGKELVKR